MNNKTGHTLVLMLIILSIVLICSCSNEKKAIEKIPDFSNSLFSKLYPVPDLSITIETNIQSIIDNKSDTANIYQKAQLTCSDNTGIILNGEISVRPRGITRRQRCEFPPLMIKANSEQESAMNIGQTKTTKLVTYCKDSLDYDQWVLKEYLSYKLYNEFTEHSFNVKWANITFKDTEGNYDEIQKFGFLIEPLEELALRTQCIIMKDDEKIQSVHKEKYKTLTMFQYMIGNTDWNFTRRHNVRLLKCDERYGPIPVPYDFDFSGFVNPVYAKPHPMLPIKSIRDRLFQWRGSVDEDFSDTCVQFEKKRQSLRNIYASNDLSLTVDIGDLDSYIDDFYKKIATPSSIKKEIIKARTK